MTKASTRGAIQEARRSFNVELLRADYETIHGDAEQLRTLIAYLDAKPGGVYLDLATGNGYVGLALARQYAGARVVGVDIADAAIEKNADKARDLGLSNIAFHVMDGIALSFPAASFDGVVCRYALHHFPELAVTLRDIARILKTGGRLVIADPIRAEGDDADFINRFQEVQRDGHVKIHGRGALMELFHASGFREVRSHMTELSFSKDLNPAYRAPLENAPPATKDHYRVAVRDDKVHLRFEILNVLFSMAS